MPAGASASFFPTGIPLPIERIGPAMIERVRTHVGTELAEQRESMLALREFGASTAELMALLETPSIPMPPPLPIGFQQKAELILRDVEGIANVDASLARRIDYRRYIGPFIRCHELVVAEWVPILDLPDITFRVTQDVDSDGAEEEIYREGFFDVRWNAAPIIPNVTLVADASALYVPLCEPMPEIPCENEPVINTVGYMPLLNSHQNDTTGYGRRVNSLLIFCLSMVQDGGGMKGYPPVGLFTITHFTPCSLSIGAAAPPATILLLALC